MSHYQLAHLELSTRMNLALKMLDPERKWGDASALAKEHGVARKFLYQLQDRVLTLDTRQNEEKTKQPLK